MVKLLSYTPEPDKLVAAAAKICYASSDIDTLMDGLTPEVTAEFLKKLRGMGHDSPLEHASFTFAIEGVSRALMAQITRHRHASFSVRSQRYVSHKGFDTVMPESARDNPEAKEIFDKAVEDARAAYEKLISLGLKREDARFVLPNACQTQMIMTMNARSLLNFFRLRCCSRAQWEIRGLADEMLTLCKSAAPLLFAGAGPACASGACSEGSMSCGRMDEMREKYR